MHAISAILRTRLPNFHTSTSTFMRLEKKSIIISSDATSHLTSRNDHAADATLSVVENLAHCILFTNTFSFLVRQSIFHNCLFRSSVFFWKGRYETSLLDSLRFSFGSFLALTCRLLFLQLFPFSCMVWWVSDAIEFFQRCTKNEATDVD